jgi:hypothetical protein
VASGGGEVAEQQKPGPREEFEGEGQGIGEDTPHGGGQGAVGGQGGEGGGAADASPDVGEEGEPRQTEVYAPDEDVNKGEDEGSESEE